MSKSANMIIQESLEADICLVQQLIYTTMDTSYSTVYPSAAIKFFKEFHSYDRIKERYRKGKILVIEKKGNIIGTGSFFNGEILGVFINPDFQQQGYGKSLMLALGKEAKSKSYIMFLSLYFLWCLRCKQVFWATGVSTATGGLTSSRVWLTRKLGGMYYEHITREGSS